LKFLGKEDSYMNMKLGLVSRRDNAASRGQAARASHICPCSKPVQQAVAMLRVATPATSPFSGLCLLMIR